MSRWYHTPPPETRNKHTLRGDTCRGFPVVWNWRWRGSQFEPQLVTPNPRQYTYCYTPTHYVSNTEWQKLAVFTGCKLIHLYRVFNTCSALNPAHWSIVSNYPQGDLISYQGRKATNYCEASCKDIRLYWNHLFLTQDYPMDEPYLMLNCRWSGKEEFNSELRHLRRDSNFVQRLGE